jgi:hypothetical protein
MVPDNALLFHIPTNSVTPKGKLKGLDGMNELIAQNRISAAFGAKCEADNLSWCLMFARKAMRANPRFQPILDSKAYVSVTFIEPERKPRRDVPNIYGALKYLLDSLTQERVTKRSVKPGAGCIHDDSPEWLELQVSVTYDDSRVGADVLIYQIGDDPVD